MKVAVFILQSKKPTFRVAAKLTRLGVVGLCGPGSRTYQGVKAGLGVPGPFHHLRCLWRGQGQRLELGVSLPSSAVMGPWRDSLALGAPGSA